jgi:hypothetical protein
VFNNLEAPLEIVNFLVFPPNTFFFELKEFRCSLLELATKFQYHVLNSFHSLKNPKQLNNSQRNSGIYLHPTDINYSYTSTTYIHINIDDIHKQTFITHGFIIREIFSFVLKPEY